MNKKSIFRDHFSWKVRTFAPAFRKGCGSFYCSITLPNCDLERDLMSKTYILLKLRSIAQTSFHKYIGAVAGLAECMDGACAFFMPIS